MKKIGIISAGAVVILAVSVILGINFSKLSSFKRAYDKGEYERAVSIYEKLGKNNTKKLEAESYIISRMNAEVDKYKNEKITVSELSAGVEKVQQYFDFPELDKYSDSVRKAIDSEQAYEAAVIAENESRYADAIGLYRNVLMNNPNYEEVSDKIPELEEKYKKYIEESFPIWREKSDYISALWEIGIARKVFDENAYEQEKQEFELIRSVAEQEFTEETQQVYSFNERVSQLDEKTSLVVAQVQNNSDKVIKEYTIVFCGYDKSGKKLKLSGSGNGECMKCYNKNAALKPGENTGSAFGWELGSDAGKKIAKIESCVVNVIYADDTKWENPYYNFWCDEHDIVDYKK